MITKFKIYEGLGSYPKEGSYIIGNSTVDKQWNHIKITQQHIDYLNTHVGKVTELMPNVAYPYRVEYDNPPEFMKKLIQDNNLWFSKREILYCSNDKTNCEAWLESKKYNI